MHRQLFQQDLVLYPIESIRPRKVSFEISEAEDPDNNRNIQRPQLDTVEENDNSIYSEKQADLDDNGNPINRSGTMMQRVSKRGSCLRSKFKRAATLSTDTSIDSTDLSIMKKTTKPFCQLGEIVRSTLLSQSKGCPAPAIWTPGILKPPQTVRPVNFSKIVNTGRRIVMTIIRKNPIYHPPKDRTLSKNVVDPENALRSKLAGKMSEINRQIINCIEEKDAYVKGKLFNTVELPSDFPIMHFSKLNVVERWRLMATKKTRDLLMGYDFIQGNYEEITRWCPNHSLAVPQTGYAKESLLKCIIVIGLKSQNYAPIEELEMCWMDRTGILDLCRRMPSQVTINKISFLRRIPSKSDLNDPTLYEPFPQNNNNDDDVKPQCRTPTTFTYFVIARLAPMEKHNLVKLLEFIYNFNLERMKGYITVYKELVRHKSDSRPHSQQGMSSNSGSKMFCRQNTL